ncbi:hypothetical protein L1785_22090 [Antribacter sp. KLBMP9083]|uniref:Uncharacterized protein n=2 Tax=Antribacter soli TaxID=2910976 RepID=A0AA41QIH8_9MICO|nr:hypothetical protein [Antribacter soli]MCF4123656.1 hypothetical protein [Antribacter soli]
MIGAWLRERWRFVVVLLAAGAVIFVVVLHLISGDPHPVGSSGPALQAGPRPVASATTGGAPSRISNASPAASGSDPVATARRAASILFNWDTTTDTLGSVTTDVLAVADPTGEQTPGLLADLTAYLPDPAWWERLREYETRQRVDLDTVEVPDAWTRAVATGQVADLLPGTYAVNVVGTLHRSGVVAGRPESFAHPVELTMFVSCEPALDECWLLRLGVPGTVLE